MKKNTWYNNDCKTNLYLRHKCQYPPKCKPGYDAVSIYSNRHNCPEYMCLPYNLPKKKLPKPNIKLEIIKRPCPVKKYPKIKPLKVITKKQIKEPNNYLFIFIICLVLGSVYLL